MTTATTPDTTFEVYLRNAINGRCITRACATRAEAEEIAETERPFNNTAAEIFEVRPRTPVALSKREVIGRYEYPGETITIVEHTYDNGHRYRITRTVREGWSMIRTARLDWNDWGRGHRLDLKHALEACAASHTDREGA